MDPAMIVIFGATGDLTKRKLIPALHSLYVKKQLHPCTPIVAIGRRPLDDTSFIEHLELEKFLKDARQETLEGFTKSIRYVAVDIERASQKELQAVIERLEQEYRCGKNKLFYLAVPPTMFAPITKLIEPLRRSDGWRRVVFEKPFGHDESSAKTLNEAIMSVFDEDDVFRMDHYLGKALVQNMFAFRFSNPLFDNSWNKEDVDRVEIVASEDLGVGSRAGYYDGAGALLDMVQNHLLQILSLVAMDTPKSLDAEVVRDETVKVIEALRLDACVRGQYAAANGMPGYREEQGISPSSETETFVRLRLFVDTPRWEGVPFIIMTGKRLRRRFAHVKVFFKRTGLYGKAEQNILTIRIQPDEGIAFSFNIQNPDHGDLERVHMDFCHPCHFGPNTAEAYEALLAEVLKGNRTLFTRWDWLRASWRFIDDVKKKKKPLVFYPAGDDGPDWS